MPPKSAAKPSTKRSAPAEHPPYKEMIKEAIITLKDRNGSSRPALKKYIKANYKGVDTDRFDSLFNQALKKGTDTDFTFPKGPSGTVKLAKKDAAPKSSTGTKKTTAKAGTTKSTTTAKKPAAKKTATAKPKSSTSTSTTAKKASASSKPKANAKKPRKETAAAPAVVEKPAVLTKTKSGRVSKGTAKPAAKKKSASAPKKKAPPKKKEA